MALDLTIHYKPLMDRRGYNIGQVSNDLSEVTCKQCLQEVRQANIYAAEQVGLLPDTPVEMIKDKHLEMGLDYEGY